MAWVTRSLFLYLGVMLFFVVSSFLGYRSLTHNSILVPIRKKEVNTTCLIPAEGYAALGEGFLGSKNHRLKKIIQDSLHFNGANTRPDVNVTQIKALYEQTAFTWEENKPYDLSELLSLEMLGADHNYIFKMKMRNPQVAVMQVMEQERLLFDFPLSCTDNTKGHIGHYKLDPYLLVRQKASWQGRDLFLQEFGGEEYAAAINSERIDFMHQEPAYSIYAAPGRRFVWKEGRWQEASLDSSLYPLLVVDKVEGSQLHVTIWDVSGLHSESITLNKTPLNAKPSSLILLKYIGAKSKDKWLLKVNKTRLVVEPGDWLLHLGHRWEKILSAEAIDHYLSKINVGDLFIITELKEENGKRYLVGDLFNPSRSEKKHFQMDVSPKKELRVK